MKPCIFFKPSRIPYRLVSSMGCVAMMKTDSGRFYRAAAMRDRGIEKNNVTLATTH